jgi:hypothetical protein
MKKLNLLFLSLFINGLIGTTALFGQTTGDFRSAGSGTWATLGTWQTWNGSNWVAASSIPDSALAPVTKVTTIRSPHNVTVDATIGVRKVTVDAGATVTVNGTPVVLYIATEGMTVNGTLTLVGEVPAAAPYSVTNTTGTLTIGNGGVVNYNQTSTTSATKGGPPTATWQTGSTLNVNSIGGATASGFGTGNGQDFYNLNWDVATQGTFGWGFNNTIGGTVKILRTGTAGRVQLFGGSDGTLNIMGDLIVSGAASLTSNGTSSVTHDTINLYGKLNVNTTGNFSVSRGSQGSKADSTGDTTGTAIWNFYGDSVKIIAGTMNNSFKTGGGGGAGQRFVFKKSGTQYLTITPSPTNDISGNITPIEVDAGTTVSLASPVNVTTLYLSGGMIVSSASNPLIMGWFDGALSTLSSGKVSPLALGSSTSFVSGPMAYLYATAGGTTTKIYPIGKGGIYRPLSLSFTQTAATLSTYTAEMFNSGIVSNTLPPTLNSVSSGRYYKISEGAGGSAFTAGEVKLSYDTDDGVTNAAILRIAQGPSAGGGTWVDLGGSGNTIPAGTITSSNTFTDLTTKTIFALAKASTRTLTLTAFLQGYTNTGGTAMNFAPSAVTVELHNATTPWALVESQTGSLTTAGVGTFNFTTAVNGTNYYIVVKTWNTIETWSATAVSFTAGSASYNFTSAATQAYASNMIQKGTKWCIFSGDVNQDGYINLSDYVIVNYDSYHLVTGVVVTDLTGDQYTNLNDYVIVNYNSYNLVEAHTPLLNPAAGMIKPPIMVNIPK